MAGMTPQETEMTINQEALAPEEKAGGEEEAGGDDNVWQ